MKRLFCKHDYREIARSRDNHSILSRCSKCGALYEFAKFLNVGGPISEKMYISERKSGWWIDPKDVSPVAVEPVIEKKRDIVTDLKNVHRGTDGYTLVSLCYEAAAEIERLKIPQKVTGSTSDGYHTFDELYRHRGILFALICADHKDIAWKALKHSDGTMYPGMFLCGIDTPYGQATYHMDLNPFWNLIQVKELTAAPEWDGHTPDMALNRIAAMAADRFVPLEHGVVED